MSNNVYKKIMREYEETRFRNEKALVNRINNIHKAIPMIETIDENIRQLGIKMVLETIQKGSVPKEMEMEIEELELAKTSLLISNDFPSDYLEMEYECYKCNDTGYLDNSSKCSCLKQKLAREYYKMSNIEKVLEEQNFRTFNLDVFSDEPHEDEELSPRENMIEILKESKEFVINFDKDDTFNLLFYGSTGLGKTFMCNCIAKELLDRGYTVVYQTAYNILNILEKYKFRKDESHIAKERYDYIFEADLLIIDDLGTELSNSFTNAEIFNIVNSRSISGKKTIISTNLSISEISGTYTDRVFSRVLDKFIPLYFYGNDLRWE
ncbi:MAG: ATP-binding protein [Tissierellia bacterium]|nr:ATP-binding protein [Tissierellia bacterium]